MIVWRESDHPHGRWPFELYRLGRTPRRQLGVQALKASSHRTNPRIPAWTLIKFGEDCLSVDLNSCPWRLLIWSTVSKSLYLHMDEFYENIYLNFNGLHGDADLVSLWPLEKIASEDVDVKPIGGKVYRAIGDVMIMSDIIIACLEDRNAPLMLLHEKRILANDGEAFFVKLIAGPILE